MNNHREVILQLVKGINPATAEIFDKDHVCLNDKVSEALIYVLGILDKEEKRLERKNKLPINAGKKWTKELDDELISFYDKGYPIEEIMTLVNRTKGAIMSRLQKLGKI